MLLYVYCPNITEILLTVALNTLALTLTLLSIFMLSFIFVIIWVEANQCRFLLIICLYLYCYGRSGYQERKIRLPLTCGTPPDFCRALFCVQIFEMTGDCSCCWHWFICWASLCKASFHMLTSKLKHVSGLLNNMLIGKSSEYIFCRMLQYILLNGKCSLKFIKISNLFPIRSGGMQCRIYP